MNLNNVLKAVLLALAVVGGWVLVMHLKEHVKMDKQDEVVSQPENQQPQPAPDNKDEPKRPWRPLNPLKPKDPSCPDCPDTGFNKENNCNCSPCNCCKACGCHEK